MRGNWLFPDGSGLSFYVGSRTSGKLLRVYEKGKQLGGAASELFPDWVRSELELHNEGRVIPLGILINPGPYLAGAYPALAWVDDEQSRIATKQKRSSSSLIGPFSWSGIRWAATSAQWSTF
jgi:phage replication initiation protein